jgi:predicted transposase YbfD/YdcC
VKGNRRKTAAHLAAVAWDARVGSVSRVDKGHGRTARIEARAAAPHDLDGCPMPGVGGAIQIVRTTERPNPARSKKAKKPNRPWAAPCGRTTRRGAIYKTTTETVYVASSLTTGAGTAQALYARHRGHWGIEAKSHWVRDVDFGEDASQIRSGTAPWFMAAFNNFAISLIRLCEGIGANVKAATRKAAASMAYNVGLLRPLPE